MSVRESAVSFPGEARFHVAIRVTDLEASVAFYSKVFGTPPSKLKGDYAKFEPLEPSVNFTLNQTTESLGEPGKSRLSHLGIQLKNTGQLSAVRQRMLESDSISKEELGTRCCYAVQDKFWLQDPDGNELEFFVVLEKDAPKAEKQAAACC